MQKRTCSPVLPSRLLQRIRIVEIVLFNAIARPVSYQPRVPTVRA